MMKPLKNGLLVLGVLVVGTLSTLRVTGLEPGHPSAEEYAAAGRSARPGLWLKGEVVREAVTNWDWVNQFSDPFGEDASALETRTWYGIPHSVRVLLVPRGDELYLQSSAQTFRLNKGFPDAKAWWRNVERDPRVRLKIGGKIYEMTVVLVQDRAEVARLRGGRDPIVKEIDADGNEVITEEWHYWRVFQRNVPEYGTGTTAASSCLAPPGGAARALPRPGPWTGVAFREPASHNNAGAASARHGGNCHSGSNEGRSNESLEQRPHPSGRLVQAGVDGDVRGVGRRESGRV